MILIDFGEIQGGGSEFRQAGSCYGQYNGAFGRGIKVGMLKLVDTGEETIAWRLSAC